MRETKEALENVSSSLEVLQEGTGRLKASLSDERASLSNTLSDPACTNGAVSHTCSSVRSTLAQLGANADFSRVSMKTGEISQKLSVSFATLIVSLLFSACRCQSSLGQRQHHPGHRPQQHRTEGQSVSVGHRQHPLFLSCASTHTIACSSRVTRPSMIHPDLSKSRLGTSSQVPERVGAASMICVVTNSDCLFVLPSTCERAADPTAALPRETLF